MSRSLSLSDVFHDHITHCYAKINNQVYHHALHHIFESSKQGSSDVALILRHAFSVLEEKGITRVTLRSDNAACYKSAELIGDLYQLSNDSLDLSRYIYSEPQAGKGPCDRSASQRKITEFTNAKRNVRDAEEIFEALTTNEPVKGTSAFLCLMGEVDKKRKKSAITGISSLYDITFEKDGILSRQHCGIGTGQKTSKSKLLSVDSNLTILKEGGFLTDDKFWVPLGDSSANGTDEEESLQKESDELIGSARRDYECSTPGCYANFLILRNLEIHETIGNHKFRSKKQTLLDYAIDSLNAKVETLDVAKEIRANDSFTNTAVTGDTGIPMGWALKKAPTGGISDNAHEEAAAYFMAQRSMESPRRVDHSKQLTGLFSRLEKLRVSGVSVARKTRGRKPSKSNRKRAPPVSSDEEVVQVENDDDEVEEEIEGEMDDEEDLVWDCIKEMHNEIFL
ncbi:hypothetical protein PRIPAC_80822 [Pristionchus pacificus]|uniref:C2H2-type domain-containing protein n=1 Tax=Pristionchus pacificus TaxID=54126 RepID=A0A2A6CQ80_PRIPA|nr:hypothetical protein PRIPAC_80822 [Pristionchus pacificus]|eukprot:PDM80248.1 hypothetical protein PRIPAC_32827 [Pristionchus pacificus]